MANTDWGQGCYTKWGCCLNPQNNGGDLTVGSMNGNWSTVRYDTYRGCCHCYPQGMTIPKRLLSSEHMFTKRLDNVRFVVVAGLFLMDMVDKML